MAKANTAHAKRRRYILPLLCLTILLLFLMRPAHATAADDAPPVDPIDRSGSYSAVLYNNTNGMPTSEANDIVQTSEGFLWIGSYGGLLRYDGETFERMDSTTGVGSVANLLVDSQDRLWIGTNDNGLALLENGTFRMWHEGEGLRSANISDIEEDVDGTVYVATAAGITTIGPELNFKHLNDPRIFNAYVDHLIVGHDGLMFCITSTDDLIVLRHGEFVDYVSHEDTVVESMTYLLPDPDATGNYYMGTGNSVVYYGDPLNSPDELEAIDISPLYSVVDMAKFGDQVWLCARNGIGLIDSQGFHCLDTLPLNNSVNRVMRDYEGNIWFTSSRQGIMKLVNNQFLNVFERYGVPETVVNSTCMHDGQLFVGTDSGLIVLGDDEVVTSVPLTSASTASGEDLEATDLLEFLDGCRIRSIIEDSQGRAWISTWRSNGLIRYDDGVMTAFTVADGLFTDQVRAVDEWDDGSIVVANTGGVLVIEGNSVVAKYDEADGIDNPEVLTVCAAPNGDIIAGTNGNGIYVISGGEVRHICTQNGLSSGIIMRVKYDYKRDLYWIVTSNSIAYMTPAYNVNTIRKFPYSNNFDLYENMKGDMWVLSSDGIYVVPTAELVANGELNTVHYGMRNGLPCVATSNSYSELTSEGYLYIAGNTGVARVDIEAPLEDIFNLRQAVPFVDVDGMRVYPDETGTFTVPSDTQKLTIYPYVYNYSLTDPTVTYRLVGFDRQTVTVARNELGPISYTNLPGKDYWFVMNLQDALGRGSKVLSVHIVKEKAITEQPWFYALMTALGGATLVLAVNAYVRRKVRALEEKHREEAERELMANELKMANRIQANSLPNVFPPFPNRTEFDLYAVMDPAREVGGDFYDFFLIDDDHLCLVIADVSGKGIPASLFMMTAKAILHSFATTGHSPAEILRRTNDALCADNNADMFVTVWLGILEIHSGKLIAANAGHEYPAIKGAEGAYELLKDKHGLVIGIMEGVRYREYELQLETGGQIFVYTDGVPEAANMQEDMFGFDRMVVALNNDLDADPKQVLNNVRIAVDEFVEGAEQNDDLTMLCLEYHGAGSASQA